ncbi:EAL domain-containing protein [Parerythrobacter jejuensis]|nr:EAL domain-containing protein [Parerythrobacter jejuensis]
MSDPMFDRLESFLADGPFLRAAIAAGEIETVFQPQYALPADILVGAEALARWQHPERGEIGAQTLFALAAEEGVTAELSRHVALSAFEQFRSWPQHLRLSVNVTPEEVESEDFASRFLVEIAEAGIDPARLTAEITEEVLLGDLPHAATSLGRLQQAGMRTALDDFGAGFCNFRYLKMLPLNYLKLDRLMVDGIVEDERDLAVLRGIVAMANALGLDVIAEGIEREGQRALVSAEGCNTYQGFLKAAPMSGRRFLALANA